jgi:tRNA threonylcarbamoyladenosine biosynthesis protein TsaB
MKILGLDTSTARLSIALWEKGKTLAKSERVPEKRHAETILPDIESVLKELNLTPKDIDGLAVGIGPGTFTGLRVGIATAQGIAQGLGRPVAGVSSFLAAAAGAGETNVLVLEDARQDLLYAAVYQRTAEKIRPILSESLIPLDALLPYFLRGDWAVTGPAAERFYPELRERAAQANFKLIPAPRCLPSAVDIAALAEAALAAGGGTPPGRITPLYLRRTQAEEMKAKQKAATTLGGVHD